MVEGTEKEGTTTIEIKTSTLKRLDELKKSEESFDDVVNKLLDQFEEGKEAEVERDWMR